MGELLTPERLALLVSVAALATVSIASVLTILLCTRWSLLYLSTLLHDSRVHLLSFLNNLYLQEHLEKEWNWRIYDRSHSHVKNIRNHRIYLDVTHLCCVPPQPLFKQNSIYIYALRYISLYLCKVNFVLFYSHQTGPGWFNSCFPYQECCRTSA